MTKLSPGSKSLIAKQKKAIRRNYLTQAVINSLLRSSLANISLDDFLKVGLNIILSYPSFVSKSKGAIYLIGDNPRELVVRAEKGLKNHLRKKQRIKSLVGVKSKKILKSKLAGSYSLARILIVYSGKLLGLLVVCLKGEPKFSKRDKDFLDAVASTLAGVIQRKKAEAERLKANQELQLAYEELQKTQYDLVQSEKLAALGIFSSGVAHEVKNPLAIILGGTEFLEKKLAGSKTREVETAIKKIKESTLRADGIVKNLLNFSKPSKRKKQRLNPKDLINDTLELLKYRVPLIRVKLVKYFSRSNTYIKIDKNQFQQVLFNVLINAIEAMPKGGTITIKTAKRKVEYFPNKKSACLIEVSDTGQGILKENLPKLFKPFFTTKRNRKGTGLGLSTSQMILKNYRGMLKVDSRIKRGTKVKIILPAA